MVEPPSAQEPQSAAIAAHAVPSANVWERLKHHKVLQWTLAYAAAAYTLLHATQMVAESFDWPHLIVRITALVLVLGVPIAVLLAWYHGHKAQHRFSTAELSLLTVLLIIAGSILWALTRGHPQTAVTGSLAPRTSIAVMPFSNLTGDPSKEYLADGMAEELIHTLARVPGLRVPARTSTFSYKGRNVDVRQIARDLQVGSILEGSVQSAGERIRITVDLIDTRDDSHIWSDSYDRRFTDLFQLQDDLAGAIAGALKTSLTGASQPARSGPQPPTRDLEAYQLYLQGNSILRTSEESFGRAMALYQQALARDPEFARALSAIAYLRLLYVRFGYAMPDAVPNAEREAARALMLDPSLAEAREVLGIADTYRGHWVDAEREFQQALSLDPNDSQIRSVYGGLMLPAVGHVHRALQETMRAYRDAPANPFVVLRLAYSSYTLGLDSDTTKYMDLAVDLGYGSTASPIPILRERIAAHAKRYAEAAAYAVLAGDQSPDVREAVKQVYAAFADPKEKPEAIAALDKITNTLEASQGLRMAWYVWLGAVDKAYERAELGMPAIARSGIVPLNLWAFWWWPDMRPFRQDPRFSAFISQGGFMDYWKQYGPPDECDLRGEVLTCR
jgi:adenylate cyclase